MFVFTLLNLTGVCLLVLDITFPNRGGVDLAPLDDGANWCDLKKNWDPRASS